MIEKIFDFNKYSSIRIGGKKQILIVQNLNEALELKENGYFIIGNMNNILLGEGEKRIMKLGKEFDYIKDIDETIEIGAATSSKKVFNFFKKNNLLGVEFLNYLPGSIGGIIKMNAGMKQYEIHEMLDSILIDGEWIKKNKINFAYRNSNINGIIFAARFSKICGFRAYLETLFKNMRNNQPKYPSCGSCFKNPSIAPAGKLLEDSGLRGYKIGDMEFSKKHANFLVNLGNGTFKDALNLINLAKEKVFQKHKIMLEAELIIRP